MNTPKKKKTKVTQTRKTFVLDTSVLLYDKDSIKSFPDNDVIIPMIVLDELDRHKEKQGITGENARHINRFLDGLRKLGHLHLGVTLKENDQTIKVQSGEWPLPSGLDNSADNRIIALAVGMHKELGNVIVVTKDINFRVKCDSLGLEAEDYYKDNVKVDSIENEIDEIFVDDSVINNLYRDGSVKSEEVFGSFTDKCQPIILRTNNVGSSKSALGIAVRGQVRLVKPALHEMLQIKGKNKEQSIALQMLLDPDISLVTLTGIAGSGKTFLTLMAGLSGIYTKKFKRIVITRPIQSVGKDMGFLPGDIDDKMLPWIKPIVDNFREGVGGDSDYFDMMKKNGQIEIAPLSFIRGRTFNDSFIIVDEAQNATIHELKTIITRAGQGSKIVLLGDVGQVDTPYLDTFSNGLSITVDRFKDQPMSGHIMLPKSERSELAAVASTIL